MIEKLQRIYASQCNGDWEHSWGVKIETLDNPGWRFQFDLEYTPLHYIPFETVRVERNKNDWMVCQVENQAFIGGGGPLNLEEIIECFVTWWEQTASEA